MSDLKTSENFPVYMPDNMPKLSFLIVFVRHFEHSLTLQILAHEFPLRKTHPELVRYWGIPTLIEPRM